MNNRWTPLLCTLLGLATVGSLSVFRLLFITDSDVRILKWGAALLYLGWLIWESQISIRETKNRKDTHDQGTLELAAAVKFILLFACLMGDFRDSQFHDARGTLGLAFMVLGIGLRAKAILQLGTAYSHRIRLPRLPLITAGPYRWVRHPAYLGTALAHTGVVLVFANPFSWAALGLWYGCVCLRTHVEDRWLMETVPEYREYAARVPSQLLPFPAVFQGILPIFLSLFFVTTITVLVYFSLPHWAGWDRVQALTLIGCYLGWLGLESKVAMRETKKKKTDSDSGTLELYAFGRAATVITALAVPIFWPEEHHTRGFGLLLFLTGVTFRLWAIHTLGELYSHRVRMVTGHTVVQSGPYQWIRHPAYTGMLLAHVGFVLFFFNWSALAVFFGVFLPAVVLRILTEEKTLLPALPGYAEYALPRKRLLPFIW